jgi:hypothetical protein
MGGASAVSNRDPRFDLGSIAKNKAIIEQAKVDANKREGKSGGPLMALVNLPWLIAAGAWIWWEYFR